MSTHDLIPELPKWVLGPTLELPEWILGAEGEDDANDADGDDSGNDEGSQDAAHDDADDPKVIGLKTALAQERLTAKQMKAELKELRKLKEEKAARELADKSDLEQALIREEQEKNKTAKLAAGFLNERISNAVRVAAQAANFIDPEDAISGVDRASLVYEQDTSDPSVITLDVKSVQKAVKDLATRKPHFVRAGTDDGEPTGGKFGGAKTKRQTDTDTLKSFYPGL